ncbi:response regulator [Candidatus Riflebacteria bacterium]
MEAKKKILLVDDEEANIFGLEIGLEEDYEIQSASDGREALQKMGEFKPDLVILDIMMPVMNGLEFCRQVRTDKEFRLQKIIAVSGKASVPERLEAYAAGADDYMTKPFNLDELRAKIKVFLRLKHMEELSELKEELIINIKESEIAEKKASETARQALHAKNTFLANISHELRTPLNGILGFTSLALKEADQMSNAKLVKNLEVVKENGENLLKFLNDLIELARLESDSNTFSFHTTNMKDILQESIPTINEQAGMKNIEIKLESSEGPFFCNVDLIQINRAITQLISNAIHFSPQNSFISIFLSREDDHFVARISDNGPGIPKAEIKKIFQAFTQSSLTETGSGGKGIGLSICRAIVQAHKGKIRAENNPEGGASFYISIPMVETHRTQTEVERKINLSTPIRDRLIASAKSYHYSDLVYCLEELKSSKKEEELKAASILEPYIQQMDFSGLLDFLEK